MSVAPFAKTKSETKIEQFKSGRLKGTNFIGTLYYRNKMYDSAFGILCIVVVPAYLSAIYTYISLIIVCKQEDGTSSDKL